MRFFTLSFVFFGLTLSAGSQADENIEAKVAGYRNIVKEFGGALKSELMTAVKAGGPISALQVCNTQAAKISADISKKSGITVARTSLKPRRTLPDAWETEVLNTFEKRKMQGEDPQKLEFYQVVEKEGQRQLRYMKAIMTEELCLTCHGTQIAPDVSFKIQQLYPQDKATGFKVGDIRGTFTLTETLPAAAK